MNQEKIFSLVERCMEKACEDFLKGNPVDTSALLILINDFVQLFKYEQSIREKEAHIQHN